MEVGVHGMMVVAAVDHVAEVLKAGPEFVTLHLHSTEAAFAWAYHIIPLNATQTHAQPQVRGCHIKI